MKYRLGSLLALAIGCGTTVTEITRFQCTAEAQYASPNPAIGAQAISRAAIVMRFSPLGETVVPTVVPAVF